MAFVVVLATGELIENQSLEDARRSIAAVREMDRAAAWMPAQIWEAPDARRTPRGFSIPPKRLVEEHMRRGVLEVGPPAQAGPTAGAAFRLGHPLWLGSCDADYPWLVDATLEEWATFAGRDDWAWARAAEAIRVRIAPGGPPREVRRALIAARHPGWNLRTASTATHVRICRPVNGEDHGTRFDPGEILADNWGIAYPTRADALGSRA